MAFTTLATLILELSLTRIFSVVFYYHFAFLAISVALFGLGAGGVFSYVVAGWRGNLFARLGTLALVNSIAVVLSLWFSISRTDTKVYTLALVYAACTVPFFLAGATVSLVISEAIERVHRVYFCDLLGAAGGCLLLVPLLNLVGGPSTVIAAAVLFAVSAAVWFNLAGASRLRAAAVLVSLLLAAFVVVNAKAPIIDIRYAKGMELPNELFVKWNSFSRIAVARDRNDNNLGIIIDADASTGIAPYDVSRLTGDERWKLLHAGPGFVYILRPAAKTLIIGPGGGWDVVRAFASGSKDITGVEINPIIATTVMRQRFAAVSHDLYFRPEVHIFVEDGRSFIRRTPDTFQVLEATLVDTWAATAAGAFALSENNLYTTNAFRDYLTHLTDDGVLSFTRWGFNPPRESLRLVSLAMDALAGLGETQPWRNVMVIRENAQLINQWGAQDTVLISRKPFTPQDVSRARLELARGHIEAVYLPGDHTVNPFESLLLSPDPGQFYKDYPYDVSPVDDNRPFFFYTVQPRDIWAFVTTASRASADFKVNSAVPLLFGLMALSLIATALVLVLPRLVLGARLPREPGVLTFLWYFLFIGAGYILIQVALIQKFVLFLGHPTYALTVVILSMLLASGFGSFFGRRVVASSDRRLQWVLGVVTALVIVLALVVSPLTGAGVGLPLPVKVILTMLIVAAPAFLMGMPFPAGLARLEVNHHSSVRWAWSLNAAASVLGSALAVFLAIYLGLRTTLMIGGGMYLCALGIIAITRVPEREATSLLIADR